MIGTVKVSQDFPTFCGHYLGMHNLPVSHLAVAVRHVAEGRRIVAVQHAMIAKLKANGLPTVGEEQMLRVFKGTLRVFLQHEQQLRAQRPSRAAQR